MMNTKRLVLVFFDDDINDYVYGVLPEFDKGPSIWVVS